MCVCVCVCARSHCSEHPWRLRSELFIPDKRSIFALTSRADDGEPAEQCSVDDDDDASDGDVTQSSHCQLDAAARRARDDVMNDADNDR